MNNTITVRATGILLSLLLCAGCTTHRVNQFSTFATAGNRYSAAMIALTEATAITAVDANSQTLLYSRGDWSENIREDNYQKLTVSLNALLEELHVFQEHTLLLKTYFRSLSRLAESDAPDAISGQTERLVSEIQNLGGQLEKAESVKKYLRPAVTLIVANYKHKALEEELRKRAHVLERELELQSAYLKALAAGLISDAEYLKEMKQTKNISSYIERGPLDEKWTKERRELLTSKRSTDILDTATMAADNLKTTFEALIENKIKPGDFETLFSDIDAILALVEIARPHS